MKLGRGVPSYLTREYIMSLASLCSPYEQQWAPSGSKSGKYFDLDVLKHFTEKTVSTDHRGKPDF